MIVSCATVIFHNSVVKVYAETDIGIAIDISLSGDNVDDQDRAREFPIQLDLVIHDVTDGVDTAVFTKITRTETPSGTVETTEVLPVTLTKIGNTNNYSLTITSTIKENQSITFLGENLYPLTSYDYTFTVSEYDGFKPYIERSSYEQVYPPVDGDSASGNRDTFNKVGIFDLVLKLTNTKLPEEFNDASLDISVDKAVYDFRKQDDNIVSEYPNAFSFELQTEPAICDPITATNLGDGSVTFDTITVDSSIFTSDEPFDANNQRSKDLTITVKENVGALDNIEYSTEVFTKTYTVVETKDYQSDKIVRTITIYDENEQPVSKDNLGSFKNIRKETGSLKVEKILSGNATDSSKLFHFEVTLSDTEINGTFGDMEFENGVASFTLKGGQSLTASNLPAGITYTIKEKEANKDGYTTTVNNSTGEIKPNTTSLALFTNTKNKEGKKTSPPPVVPVPNTGLK